MRAIIVEDEENALKELDRLISKYLPEVRIVGVARNVEEARLTIETNNPEILFLDIELGQTTSFDLLAQLTSTDFSIIFTTGHQGYALEAFKYSAVDYLLKPIDSDDLVAAVDKARKIRYSNDQSVLLQNLLQSLPQNLPPKKIALKTLDTVHIVEINEIVRCESEGNYTRFVLANEKDLLISKTLRDYESLLQNNGFYRVHRSHLINLQWVTGYEKSEGGKILMKVGGHVPISFRRKDKFLSKMDQLFKS